MCFDDGTLVPRRHFFRCRKQPLICFQQHWLRGTIVTYCLNERNNIQRHSLTSFQQQLRKEFERYELESMAMQIRPFERLQFVALRIHLEQTQVLTLASGDDRIHTRFGRN